MDLPKPPEDQELKNIIDKLAQFVARNGPEFEHMTKVKQKDNPKFSFLFSGEHFNYYQYKVTTEQAILKHRPVDPAPNMNSQNMDHRPQQMPGGFPGPYNPPYEAGQYQYNQFPASNFPGHDTHQFPSGPGNQNFHQGSHPNDGQMNIQNAPPNAPGSNNFQAQFQPADRPPQFAPNSGFPNQGTGFPNQGRMDLYKQSQTGFPQNMNMPDSTHQQGGPGRNGPGMDQRHQLPPNMMAGSGPPMVQNAGQGQGGPPAMSKAEFEAAMEKIDGDLKNLKEQVSQSEQNLVAQKEVMEGQDKIQIKDGLYAARGEDLRKRAKELELVPEEFEDLLIPITESCTKDSISNGKHWIFSRASTQPCFDWISDFLLYKCSSSSAPFTHKLHIIYLVNDVLHHCIRKGAEGVKGSLEKVLSPMYCHAVNCASDEQRTKLDKLLSLWKSKMRLDEKLLNELHAPAETLAAFEAALRDEFPDVVASVTQLSSATLENYTKQHKAFVQHSMNQIQKLEQQKSQLEKQQEQFDQQQQQQGQFNQQQQDQFNQQQPNQGPMMPVMSGPTHSPANFASMPPLNPQQQFMGHNAPLLPQPTPGMPLNHPPPLFPQGSGPPVMDFSKPPPGFNAEENDNIIPSVPYYELPAALMGPLIKLCDNNYTPLDPSKLRLPLPSPPTERLLMAVESFYCSASHERPRNSDGWEQLGLFEFYKAKSTAVKEKEYQIQQGERDRSRSPSPITIENDKIEIFPAAQGPVRRYRSLSPSAEDHEVPNTESKSGRDKTRNQDDRGRSPPQRSPSPSPRDRARRRSRSISRSRSRSLSYSPRRRRSRSRSPSHSRSMSRSPRPRQRRRSRSKSPMSRVPFRKSRSRSATPPSFGFANYGQNETTIHETNKGHQMLRNMGWSGMGLGAKEQGISEPIAAGEVRETPQERFRGLGVPSAQSDPYEAFRKNKGQAFINRMKARAEEK